MQELRFGIIGCGRVVQELHLPAWKLIREAHLLAICDPSRAALHFVSARYPGVRQYTDVDAFLEDASDLDFVVLATPGNSHFSIGEKVLYKKLHLLCEKPLSLSARDSQRLFKTAEQQGVVLTPIHNYRYRDTVKKALAYRTQGVLGDIVSASVRFRSRSLFQEPATWMRKEREHRALLFDLAYHFVDLALLFLGPTSSVRFVDAELDGTGLQYVVFGTLHACGSRGLFELMLDASSFWTQIEVQGERGSLMLEFFPDGFRMLPQRDTPLHRAFYDAGRLFRFARSLIKERLPRGIPRRALPHTHMLRAFVEALQRGGPSPIPEAEVMQTIGLLDEVVNCAYRVEDLVFQKGAETIEWDSSPAE
ncbi:MAG: Gfo/Idh/MocA family protein [Candidatus Binatia bacterium]